MKYRIAKYTHTHTHTHTYNINKAKNWFFEKMNRIDKSLVRLTKKKKERRHK